MGTHVAGAGLLVRDGLERGHGATLDGSAAPRRGGDLGGIHAGAGVVGRRSGEHAAATARGRSRPDAAAAAASIARTEAKVEAMLAATGPRPDELREGLADAMYANCGVFRTGDGMAQARDRIAELRATYDQGVLVQDKGRVFNNDLTYAIEVGYLLEMGDVLTRCALEREESRGGHTRLDFSERDDEKWLVHSLATRTIDDPAIEVGTHPVTITDYQPAIRTY